MITGKTILELGYNPGKWFKEAISYSNEHKLEGQDLIDYLNKVSAVPSYLEPFEESLPYYKNISTETDAEIENLISVEQTMDVVMKTPTVVNAAIMPDACPAGTIGQIPVGGVVVTKNAIHPAMHSADICCSVMITGFGNISPERILNLMHSITDFGGGGRRNNIKFDLPQDLYDRMANNQYFDRLAMVKAVSNLGTQGDGNHFAFVGTSKATGETCLVTHHGSRGVGASVYKAGMLKAEKWRKQLSPNTNKINAWIPYNTPDGEEYWEALQLLREWTKLNHSVLHNWVVEKAKYVSKLHFWNEHNFVFKDGDLFYHAKGATPLDNKFVPDSTNGLRLIPLNMSQPVLIVKGEATEQNLGFAPHGAGRNISRSQHIRNNDTKTIEEIFNEETNGLDVRFFSGNIDISELPSAYKDAESVKRQIVEFGLGEIVDEIIPYGCIMAGKMRTT